MNFIMILLVMAGVSAQQTGATEAELEAAFVVPGECTTEVLAANAPSRFSIKCYDMDGNTSRSGRVWDEGEGGAVALGEAEASLRGTTVTEILLADVKRLSGYCHSQDKSSFHSSLEAYKLTWGCSANGVLLSGSEELQGERVLITSRGGIN